VLIASARAVPGGAERAAAALARQLSRHGIASAAAVGADGPLAEWLVEAGCETTVVKGEAEVRELVDRVRPAVVIGLCARGHLLAGPTAEQAGLPAIWWQLNTPRPGPRERMAAAVRAAVVVCPNRSALAAQRSLTPDVPGVYIPLGARLSAATDRRPGDGVTQQLGWGGCPIIGTVGRIEHVKGQDVFLRAAALLAETRPDARFLVVGGAIIGTEGSFPGSLPRLARRLGIEDRVRFTGHVDDVGPYLDALDVAVCPSRREAFGLAVVEALDRGVPVVATDTDGPREILAGGEAGLLVPAEDPRALADALARVLADSSLSAQLSTAGRRRARSFSEGRMGSAFARLIRRVAANGAAGSRHEGGASRAGRSPLGSARRA
jgi:glycosyltransferase involved in cell wall biosynthesis